MAPPLALTSLNLSGSYGGILVVAFITASLWGVFNMQCFIYHMNYPKDSRLLKILVVFIWLAGTAHQLLLVQGMYNITIINFGSTADLVSARPELIWIVLPSVLVMVGCQAFFTFRLWLFSGKKIIIPLIAIPAMITELVTNMFYMVISLNDLTASPLHKIWRLALALNLVAVATDVCLAGGMVYYLLRDRATSENVNRMIIWLVIFSVNSGLWTAVLALTVLITIIALPPDNLTFAAIYFVSSPMYCNALLGNLNSRDFVRGRGQQSHPMEILSDSSRAPDTGPGIRFGSQKFRIHSTSFHVTSPGDDNLSVSEQPEKEVSLSRSDIDAIAV